MRTNFARPRPVPRLLAGLAVVLAGLAAAPLSAAASSAPGLKTLSYRGEQAQVPASWPVYDLSSDPSTCVRFNRNAVYEGAEGNSASCPASLVGVASALQLQPLTTDKLAQAETADDLSSATINSQSAYVSADDAVTHRLVAAFPDSAVLATLSFRNAGGEAIAQEILESFTEQAAEPGGSAPAPAAHARLTAAPSPRTTTPAPHQDGSGVYKGDGFDTCYAPSEPQMATWRAHSPFRAVGVYIGGVNAACDNVSASWLAAETAAGWAVFPLYVGLQAPCANQKSLASLASAPATAALQGTQAADNAVAVAASLGIGTGNTLYYDMEAWNTGSSSCNKAVLAFVGGWSKQLAAKGYRSGLYGSLLQGIDPEIESLYGTAAAPKVIYFAAWDGVATTTSPYIPSADWPGATRIKQYDSDARSYGGVRIDVDEDYLDAPTVRATSNPPPPTTPPPAASTGPSVTGLDPPAAPTGVTVTISGSGFGSSAPAVYFGSVKSGAVIYVSPSKVKAVVPPQAVGTVAVTVRSSTATSPASSSDRFTYLPLVAIASQPSGGYWVTSSKGNVESFGASWYGSTAGKVMDGAAVGTAATATGYLLVTTRGNVYNFNTPFYGSLVHRSLPAPVVGIAATATGYLVATAKGNVYNFNTPFYGSLVNRSLPAPVVGIAATATGYLLVTAKGNVYNFHTAWYGSEAHDVLPSPVVGVAATSSGYLLAGGEGEVYSFNTPNLGSEPEQSLPAKVVGIAATSTGYLLATSIGNIFNFGTAFENSPASLGR